MLRRLRHRNIVGFSGVCVHDNKGIILMVRPPGRNWFCWRVLHHVQMGFDVRTGLSWACQATSFLCVPFAGVVGGLYGPAIAVCCSGMQELWLSLQYPGYLPRYVCPR